LGTGDVSRVSCGLASCSSAGISVGLGAHQAGVLRLEAGIDQIIWRTDVQPARVHGVEIRIRNPKLTVTETRRLERVGKALDEFLDKVG
jgi:hypothetical protein